ncbi:aminotransferase [Paenibacillus baekrokdamisoli]|uniref:Aminotransferase n=1 Tax=Paenibacillus baekrokdamisoli TaxID=1712516 RepID=A0A3G9JDQ5_9BACL|nr:TIM barrel protein [Paenibacillus baekrokdamisoli]MBB3070923.1 sugar phosphate isomerase/epimerase [Paenibacillus baekrokdamisoli]BBH22138.1 aminotransferase [Paenibacillus baekrokdamisoli]
MANLKLGINLGFAINKYVEPEVWARIVAEDLGIKYVQFVADLLNVFLPPDIVDRQVERINVCTQKHNLAITSTFTSAFTRVNHFMHPDADTRKAWLNWFKRFADISVQMGARTTGSHFGILTFADYDNVQRREYIIEEGIKHWQDLSWYCKELGMEYLNFEPMSIPREMANTVEDTKELLARLNDGAGIPFKVCLDVGHAPHPNDRDPYRWVRELGSVSPIIHIQQTEKDHSRHWPFTEEYNKLGIIHGEPLIEAIEQSGATEAEIIFELSHREAWSTEFRIIQDHIESVNYWRQFIKN